MKQDKEVSAADLLAVLAPTQPEQPQPHRALQALKRRQFESQEETFMPWNTIRKYALPAGLAVAVAASLAFAPVRALARELLSVFRAERFVLVEVDEDRLEQLQAAVEQLEAEQGELIFGDKEMLSEPGEPVEVASFDEAAGLAGFSPRTPQGYDAPARIEVFDGGSMRFTPDVETMGEVFSAVGLDASLLPAEIDGQPFTVTTYTGIAAFYGEEGEEGGLAFAQMPTATTEIPEGVDAQALGVAAFQLFGMSAQEAQSLAQNIDWTTSLVVPIPAGRMDTLSEVTVDGVTGLQITADRESRQERLERCEEADLERCEELAEAEPSDVLVWQKDGMTYMLATSGEGFALAEAAAALN